MGNYRIRQKEGRKVFEKLKCGECHSGPYYTDMKMHRIGEDIEFGERVGYTYFDRGLAYGSLSV